jgi:hypothetical protein
MYSVLALPHPPQHSEGFASRRVEAAVCTHAKLLSACVDYFVAEEFLRRPYIGSQSSILYTYRLSKNERARSCQPYRDLVPDFHDDIQSEMAAHSLWKLLLQAAP